MLYHILILQLVNIYLPFFNFTHYINDKIMKHFYLFLGIYALLTIITSCSKEDDWSSSVPYASVNISIQTQIENEFNNPLYSKQYPNQGYAGVIVITNESASGIYAYDLCCPHEAPQKNILVMDGSISVKCPKCNSKYSLTSGGQVESGPSTERLKEYRNVRKNGSFYRIWN